MPISIKKQVSNGKEIFVWTDDIDEKSLQQLINVASLPFIYKHVSAMPDVHAGDGATIGSVIATEGAVIPAAVGVDIRMRNAGDQNQFNGQRHGRGIASVSNG